MNSVTPNLVAGIYPGSNLNTFVQDRSDCSIVLASAGDSGTPANTPISWSSLSGDGRHVSFQTAATNLVNGITHGYQQIYLKDLNTNALKPVSIDTNGNLGIGNSIYPFLSYDGRYVLFTSNALITGNLDTSNANIYQTYVRDTKTGNTTLVSTGTDDKSAANATAGGAAISGDGQLVFFLSKASNLVFQASGKYTQAYIRDLHTKRTKRVISSLEGGELNGDIVNLTASPDGNYLAFSSNASNVIAQSPSGQISCYLFDRRKNQTILTSVRMDGTPISGDCSLPDLSANAEYVGYNSTTLSIDPKNTIGINNAYITTKTDSITFTVTDPEGDQATGTVIIAAPLIDSPLRNER